MKLVLIAVGTKPPRWVVDGFAEYAKRFPRQLPLELVEVRAEHRSGASSVDAMRAREAERILAAMPTGARLVLLDERGKDVDTAKLAVRVAAWQAASRDVAIVIGGPDGVDATVREAAVAKGPS